MTYYNVIFSTCNDMWCDRKQLRQKTTICDNCDKKFYNCLKILYEFLSKFIVKERINYFFSLVEEEFTTFKIPSNQIIKFLIKKR